MINLNSKFCISETLNFQRHLRKVKTLVITEEDIEELKNLLKIATSQIPRYFNLINSKKESWQISNINECVLGMVFEKYVHDSGQYLSNKGIDENQQSNIENNMEAYDEGINLFSDRIDEIKRQIKEN